jgi:DNA-directed RNA polymerase specialized sigma subunit
VQQNFENEMTTLPDFTDDLYVDLVKWDDGENYEFTFEFREEVDNLRFGGIRKLLKDREYTTKQKAIVYLMMDGCSNKEIADSLSVSQRYVRKVSNEAIGFIKNLIYEGYNYSRN